MIGNKPTYKGGSSPAKKRYKALVRHDGIIDETIVYENTLGFNVTWTKTVTGEIVSNIDVSDPNVFINNLREDQIYFQSKLPYVEYIRTIRVNYEGNFLKLQRKYYRNDSAVAPMDGIYINVEVELPND